MGAFQEHTAGGTCADTAGVTAACAAGAIYANDTSNVTVLDSTFQRNGGGQGGAIALWNSTLMINGTDFTGNSGRSAGACTTSP